MAINFEKLVLGPSMMAFAADVAWTPDGEAAVPDLRGVFGDEYVEVDTGNEAPVSATTPTLGIRLSEWPGVPAPEDVVAVNSRTYEVWDTQPDGEGGMKLILRAAT